MREIKFRAWFRKQGKLSGPFLLELMSSALQIQMVEGNVELLQFTGLKDKKGKEIYEGDLLIVFDEAVVPVTDEGQGPTEPCNHIVPVEMRYGVWGFEIPKSDGGETGWFGLHYWNEQISSDGFEVIGNIYENLELLSV